MTKKSSFLIPLKAGERRGWNVTIDGSPLTPGFVEIHHPSFGTLAYGKHPLDPTQPDGPGYDSWAFAENGGGGSVIVPFAIAREILYVGLLDQQRNLQGGRVLNVPRGFLEPGKTHFSTANQEVEEEVGYARGSVFELYGNPANPNSAFFDTRGAGEGVRFFGLRFTEADLRPAECGRFHLRPEAIRVTTEEARQRKLLEGIRDGVVFVSWRDAMAVSDMFTLAGVGRLLAVLSPSSHMTKYIPIP